MKAIVITAPGGPEVLRVQEAETPQPGAEEILVRVIASALNRADILQRQGRYPPPVGAPQNIPGIEFAGEVVATGSQAHRWRKTQRVFGIVSGGGHAEFLVAHEQVVAEIPTNLDWTQAAAIPEAFITAHDALCTQAELRCGETVLVHAVGSGVGLAAAQIVAAFGAKAYGVSRTADKTARARDFGLTDGITIENDLQPLIEKVKQWTQCRGVDIVLDLVGGSYLPASIECLALKGRLMLVGTVAGGKAEISLGPILSKRLRLQGTVLRARTLPEKIQATQAFTAAIVPLLAQGRLRPVVDSEFALEDVQAAHRRMESNESFGKIVLRISR